jgi:hypothetical protein
MLVAQHVSVKADSRNSAAKFQIYDFYKEQSEFNAYSQNINPDAPPVTTPPLPCPKKDIKHPHVILGIRKSG